MLQESSYPHSINYIRIIDMTLNNLPPISFVAKLKNHVKRHPSLRNFLVGIRAFWWRIKYRCLLLKNDQGREAAARSMPLLGELSRGSCSITKEIRQIYTGYTKDVSYEGMPISFESACFLWSMCEALNPKRILDMGSGFSSFVFRHYQRTASPDLEIWSVDESAEWLGKTKDFLLLHHLSDRDMYTWGEFQTLAPPQFDLISHDLGYMHERPDILERILTLRTDNGIIVVDDYQNPTYRAELDRRLHNYETLEGHDIRWLTLDRFLRYSLLIRQKSESRRF